MKVLHIGFQDHGGGAAESMMRIHNGLLKLNVNSNVLVLRKKTNGTKIFGYTDRLDHYFAALRREILRKPMQLVFKELRESYFSLNILPSFLTNVIKSYKPDILNIHWINSETLPIYSIKVLAQNVVWTLHDLWPIQGIYHLDKEKINNKILIQIDRYFYKKKIEIIKDHYFITPSSFVENKVMKNCNINKKNIFRISNSVDKNIFKPQIQYKLKQNKILFIGNSIINDFNKGFDLLKNSCELLQKKGIEFELIIAGDNQTAPKTNFKLTQIGHTMDKNILAKLYSESKVTVIPSRFENFPLVVLESLSSGTPVTCFDVGGLSEIISHKNNGWLAKPFDINSFALGIEYYLTNKNFNSTVCRESINNYTTLKVANSYKKVYEKIVTR